MSDKLTIEVNQDDIAQGIARTGDKCPVALAIKRETATEFPMASSSRMWIEGAWVKSPKAVRDFIRAFDEGKSAEPFSFDVPVTLAGRHPAPSPSIASPADSIQ